MYIEYINYIIKMYVCTILYVVIRTYTYIQKYVKYYAQLASDTDPFWHLLLRPATPPSPATLAPEGGATS